MNVTVVGEAATQTLTNKVYKGAIFEDVTESSKKITFNLGNLNDNTNYQWTFPEGSLVAPLNNGTDANVIVSELATQTVANKTLENVRINNPEDLNGVLNIDVSNIDQNVTISFPNGDATLLSTNNTEALGVSFGGAIAAPVLGGQLRLQSFFQAGW